MSSRSGRSYKCDSRTRMRLYGTWNAMLQRCYNPSFTSYQSYGGSGITVCKEWRDSFAAFNGWAVESGWEEGLTLDRIDGRKGYSPKNCRWADRHTQRVNRVKATPQRAKNDRPNKDIRSACALNGVTLKALAEWYGESPKYTWQKMSKYELTDLEKEILKEGILILKKPKKGRSCGKN